MCEIFYHVKQAIFGAFAALVLLYVVLISPLDKWSSNLVLLCLPLYGMYTWTVLVVVFIDGFVARHSRVKSGMAIQ